MNKIIPSLIAIFSLFFSFAQTPTLETHWSQPNGMVDVVKKDTVNNIVYLGGYFNYVGSGERYHCVLDGNTGDTDVRFDNANEFVNTSISDGNGGWYIGGYFNKVGDSTRNGIAHLNAAGKVTAKFSGASIYSIKAFQRIGNVLYVGGNFTSVNGQTRNHLAAFDLTTGALLNWNPNANGTVINKMVSDGTNMYVSGDFTTIAGVTRTKLAAVNIVTGAATSWNPNPDDEVSDLLIQDGLLYVSGAFTLITNVSRARIAAFDVITGSLTSWNPGANGRIASMAINDNTIYIGGEFTFVGTGIRNYVAAIDIPSAAVTSWNPTVNETVSCLAVNENTLIVAGGFTSINTQPIKYLASFDLVSGTLNDWNPNPTTATPTYPVSSGQAIYSIVCVNNKISLSGEFSGINGVYRNNIVALDGTTGKPTAWNPDVSNEVLDISLNGDLVYIAGSFLYVNTLPRYFIAAIDRVSGNPTSWSCNDFDTFGAPYCLHATDNVIYVGGMFTKGGGQDRNNLVALDAVTGSATAWNPNADGIVSDMILKGNTLYVGGSFSSIGGEARKCLAAVDIQTGNVTAWNPIVSASQYSPQVMSIYIYNNMLYLTGSFTALGGEPRNNIGSVDLITGAVTPWLYGNIAGLVFKNNRVYVTPTYLILNNQRIGLTSLDARTGEMGSWAASVNNGGFLYIVQDKLYITRRAFHPITSDNFVVYSLPCYEPVTPVIAATSTSICDESTVDLTIQSGNLNDAADWKWYEGNCTASSIGSGSSISVSPIATTTYFVRATGGCIQPMACEDITISVNDPLRCTTTATVGQTAVSVVSVYPNPNNGACTITSSALVTTSYNLVNAFGQVLMQIDLNSSNDYKNTIENLENGMYFLYAANDGKTSCQKIVVSK